MKPYPLLLLAATYCLCANAVTAPSYCLALQIDTLQKDKWTLQDGTVIEGRIFGFGRKSAFAQRHVNGNISFNGQRFPNEASSKLFEALCKAEGHGNSQGLREWMGKTRTPQLELPFFTVFISGDGGQPTEVPVVLLSPQDVQDLRPEFERWRTEQQREFEQRLRDEEIMQNQRTLMRLQAEANRPAAAANTKPPQTTSKRSTEHGQSKGYGNSDAEAHADAAAKIPSGATPGKPEFLNTGFTGGPSRKCYLNWSR